MRDRPRAGLGVIVLGMHRSGTSAVSRLLNLIGLSLGPGDDLVAPRDSNPTGHWENVSLKRMNERILGALGGHASAPLPLVEGWEDAPELDGLRRDAGDLVRSILFADQWVWKDPRTCLTLPIWLRVIDVPVAAVLVHRNPLEVAVSLERRDGRQVPLGLAMWERYVRSALTNARGLPVYVTSYEQLLRDPIAWCENVAGFLRDRGAEIGVVPCGSVTSFIQAELRHSEFDAGALDTHPAVSESLRAVYAAVGALAGPHTSFEPPELPLETPWIEPLFIERRHAVRAEHALRHAERATATAERTARKAKSRLTRIESSRSYRALGLLRAFRRTLARSRSKAKQRIDRAERDAAGRAASEPAR